MPEHSHHPECSLKKKFYWGKFTYGEFTHGKFYSMSSMSFDKV